MKSLEKVLTILDCPKEAAEGIAHPNDPGEITRVCKVAKKCLQKVLTHLIFCCYLAQSAVVTLHV